MKNLTYLVINILFVLFTFSQHSHSEFPKHKANSIFYLSLFSDSLCFFHPCQSDSHSYPILLMVDHSISMAISILDQINFLLLSEGFQVQMFTASLASAHWMPGTMCPSPVLRTKNVSRLCPRSPGGAKGPQVETQYCEMDLDPIGIS